MDSSDDKTTEKIVDNAASKLSDDPEDLQIKPAGKLAGKENTTQEYPATEAFTETPSIDIGIKCYCAIPTDDNPKGIASGCIVCQPTRARLRHTTATIPTMAEDLSILLHTWQWEQDVIPQYVAFSEPSNVSGMRDHVRPCVRPSLMAETPLSTREFDLLSKATGFRMDECVSPRTGTSNPFLDAAAAAAAVAAELDEEEEDGVYGMFPANFTGSRKPLNRLPLSLYAKDEKPYFTRPATPPPVFDPSELPDINIRPIIPSIRPRIRRHRPARQ